MRVIVPFPLEVPCRADGDGEIGADDDDQEKVSRHDRPLGSKARRAGATAAPLKSDVHQ